VIIKTYRKKGCGFVGQDYRSWERSWGDIKNIEKSYRNAEKDYSSFFCKRYFPRPPKKILEGGCGTGKYVYAYKKLGYDIIGVDFAGKTVEIINKNFPTLPVLKANVLDLPFEDGYFDCYYSGGVIEHFEEGPDKAIKEARRVLKKDGVFLAFVPYINLLRRIRFTFSSHSKKNDLISVKVVKCNVESVPYANYAFCEYMFDPDSISRYLKRNGFIVEKVYSTDFLWGELGSVFRWFLKRRKTKRDRSEISADKRDLLIDDPAQRKSLLNKILYSFFITEDLDNKYFCLPLSFLDYLSGHIIAVVARAN